MQTNLPPTTGPHRRRPADAPPPPTRTVPYRHAQETGGGITIYSDDCRDEVDRVQRRRHPDMAAPHATLAVTIRAIAMRVGYGIGLHGSMLTDLDLMAVPWVEGAAPPEVLVQAICGALGGKVVNTADRPHCRRCWMIAAQGTHIDLQVAPRACDWPATAQATT